MLLEKGKEEAADVRVARDSKSRRNSAEWHEEKAMDLLRVAFAAQESGDMKTAQTAAKLTLVQLDKLERLSKDDSARLASIHELRGTIRERLVGDSDMAAGEYKKALERKPDSTSARQKLRQVDPEPVAESTEAQK